MNTTEYDTKPGTLYGIGVGPGDPDLIPLKAVKILQHVDVVFAASSTKNSYSLAVNIARAHIPETAEVRILSFPMTQDVQKAGSAWETHAKTIVRELDKGNHVAFLTLGDPLTYSTYGYVLKQIKRIAPHVPVETIPGITSYQASAACLNLPLVEGEEALLIMSGVSGGDRLRALTDKPENVVFLKAYRNIEDITAALAEANRLDSSVGISQCGLENQQIIWDISEFNHHRPDYWTLIISKKNKDHVPGND